MNPEKNNLSESLLKRFTLSGVSEMQSVTRRALESVERIEDAVGSGEPFASMKEARRAETTRARTRDRAFRPTPPGSPPPPVPPPGPIAEEYDGPMEARLEKLESFADVAKDRLARIETKLDHIDREVSNTKWWIVAQIVAGLFTVIGTGIAIQQMTVATFQAAGAQASPPPQAQQQPIIITVPQPVAPGVTQPAK